MNTNEAIELQKLFDEIRENKKRIASIDNAINSLQQTRGEIYWKISRAEDQIATIIAEQTGEK
jgi:septal ring factor EnvC (AmiA/AmiB activator)